MLEPQRRVKADGGRTRSLHPLLAGRQRMTVGNAFVCPREGGFALQRRAWGSSDAGAARHGDSLHGRREGMGSEAVLGGTQLVTDPGDRWEQAYFRVSPGALGPLTSGSASLCFCPSLRASGTHSCAWGAAFCREVLRRQWGGAVCHGAGRAAGGLGPRRCP